MEAGSTGFGGFIPHWAKDVRERDLPGVYREMAEVIGVEATVKLAGVYAGNCIYFPKLERALLSVRNQAIRHEFDGANIRALARRWGLSARHVRHIVNPSRKGKG